MVDLAVPKPDLVTAEAPTNRVGGDAFSRTGETGIGGGLANLGSGLEDVATKAAKEQAASDAQQPNAVTRDANGNIQVQPASAFILGRAGEAYESLFRTSTLARVRTMMDSDLADIHRNNAGDAAGFAKDADDYISAFASKNQGLIGNMAIGYGRQQIGQHFDNIKNDVATTGISADNTAVGSRLTYIENQMNGLASSGATETEQYRALREERAHLLDERVENPLVPYSDDQRKVDDDVFNNKQALSAASGSARRLFQQSGNLPAARAQFEKDVERLPVSEEQKLRYMGEINSHLNGANAVMQQQKQVLTDRAAALIEESKQTRQVDPQRFVDTARELRGARLFSAAAHVETASIFQQMRPILEGGSADEATAAYQKVLGMARGAQSATAVQVTPEQRDLAIRTIAGEAGGEPVQGQAAVAHVMKTRLLAGGYGPTLTDVIKSPAQFSVWNPGDPAGTVARGLSVNSPTYMQIGRIVDDVFGGKIADPTNGATNYYNPRVASPAWGPQLASGNDVSIGNHRFVGGNRGDLGELSAAQSAAYSTLIKEAGTTYNQHAQTLLTQIKAVPTDQSANPNDVLELSKMLPWVPDQKIREAAAPVITSFLTTKAASALPLDQVNQIAAAGKVMAATGQVDNIQRAAINALGANATQRTKLAQENPVAYGQVYIPADVRKTMPQLAALDTSSPATFAAGLQARQAYKDTVHAMPERQASNLVLMPGDREQLVNGLPNMDAGQTATVLNGLAGLKSDELREEMSNSAMSSAVLGVARSADPAKLQTGMGFLNVMQQRNPREFDALFPGALKELRAYQGYNQFLPADEVAKRMQEFNTPTEITTRERNGATADAYLKTLDAGTVARKFGGWFTPSNTPAGVGDQAGYLKTDWDRAYKDMFELTGKQDIADKYATEQVGKMWGVSPANGFKVMRLPPENYVPEVAGSKEWVRQQLADDMDQIVGKRGVYSPVEGAFGLEPGGSGGYIATNEQEQRAQDIYNSWSLVPYANQHGSTEADISAHRLPGYHVVATSTNGRVEVVPDAKGKPLIWYPDPRAAQEKWGESFDERTLVAQQYRAQRDADLPAARGLAAGF